MNDTFNFQIPLFNEKYGEDWADFKMITDDAVDYLFEKTWQLYWLVDPNYMTVRVAERVLQALGLEYSSTDTLYSKKYQIRKFLTSFADKSLADVYLDIAEGIVGVRGVIYSGLTFGVWKWATSRWTSVGATFPVGIKWGSASSKFNIYIDVKTLVAAELDAIVTEYRRGYILPAFYQIYLIDTAGNILRTV